MLRNRPHPFPIRQKTWIISCCIQALILPYSSSFNVPISLFLFFFIKKRKQKTIAGNYGECTQEKRFLGIRDTHYYRHCASEREERKWYYARIFNQLALPFTIHDFISLLYIRVAIWFSLLSTMSEYSDEEEATATVKKDDECMLFYLSDHNWKLSVFSAARFCLFLYC